MVRSIDSHKGTLYRANWCNGRYTLFIYLLREAEVVHDLCDDQLLVLRQMKYILNILVYFFLHHLKFIFGITGSGLVQHSKDYLWPKRLFYEYFFSTKAYDHKAYKEGVKA